MTLSEAIQVSGSSIFKVQKSQSRSRLFHKQRVDVGVEVVYFEKKELTFEV